MNKRLALVVFLLTLVLTAGCGQTATPPVDAVVSGVVTYPQKIALPANAAVEVKLVDISKAGGPAITLAQSIITTPEQVPVSFELQYDPGSIKANNTYALQATISADGKPLWTTTKVYKVITQGNPSQVELVLDMVGEVGQEVPSSGTTASVTGTVSYLERIAMPSNAVVTVRLVDVTRQDAPAVTISELKITDPGEVPVAFDLVYDPAQIKAENTYSLEAEISSGDELMWMSTQAYLIITQGNPNQADMILERVSEPPSEESSSPSEASSVTGTATYLERIAMPQNAVFEVVLQDVSKQDAPAVVISQQTIPNPGQVPISFTLPYDPAQISPQNTYVVRASLTVDGNLKWTTTQQYPVITQGQPAQVDVVMQQVGP